MELNAGNMQRVYTGYKANFNNGLGMATPDHLDIATEVPSSTSKEEYDWLGQVPGVREWLDERHIHALRTHGYTIKNRDWEQTISVSRNAIKDDTYGVYGPLFVEMGRATSAHPSELCYGQMKAGFTTPCYDGQYYFDTDHPVFAADGSLTSVSNSGGGAGAPWFLYDGTRAIKPLIFQNREKPVFTALDDVKDENVFKKKEFVYGTDARYNVGFAFWQFCYGSKQELDKTNFAAAFAALEGMKGDYGRPIGNKPTVLLVPPSLREAGLEIVNAERDAAGATNVWKGQVALKVSPWLA